MRWLAISAALLLVACGTIQQRVTIKSAWYEVLDAYEARLLKCFEGEAYSPDLPGCEVDSSEKARVEPVLVAYKTSAHAFNENPEFASCTMAKAIIKLAPLVSDSLGESFIPPAIEAYCGESVSELDLLFAETQAAEEKS